MRTQEYIGGSISELARHDSENTRGAAPSSAANPFERDNFAARRTTGHNAYDPESLLTGAEIARGKGYHDKRQWFSEAERRLAIAGELSPETVAIIAPR